MTVIKVTVPPDHTPEQEAQLVADVAASYLDSTGSDDVHVELEQLLVVERNFDAAKHPARANHHSQTKDHLPIAQKELLQCVLGPAIV